MKLSSILLPALLVALGFTAGGWFESNRQPPTTIVYNEMKVGKVKRSAAPEFIQRMDASKTNPITFDSPSENEGLDSLIFDGGNEKHSNPLRRKKVWLRFKRKNK